MTRAIALPALAALALACGPWGPQGILAGGPFLGAASASFPGDWSFSDAHPLVGIETRGALLRHLDGRVYEQVAVPVTDDAAVGALMAPVLRRQFAIEIGGEVRRIPGATRAALHVYRLDDPR